MVMDPQAGRVNDAQHRVGEGQNTSGVQVLLEERLQKRMDLLLIGGEACA